MAIGVASWRASSLVARAETAQEKQFSKRKRSKFKRKFGPQLSGRAASLRSACWNWDENAKNLVESCQTTTSRQQVVGPERQVAHFSPRDSPREAQLSWRASPNAEEDGQIIAREEEEERGPTLRVHGDCSAGNYRAADCQDRLAQDRRGVPTQTLARVADVPRETVLGWRRLMQVALLVATLLACQRAHWSGAQVVAPQSDPRPTIYSGQVSFALLLSAHSKPEAELAGAASDHAPLLRRPAPAGASTPSAAEGTTPTPEDPKATDEDGAGPLRPKRQIFERSGPVSRRQQQEQQAAAVAASHAHRARSSCSQAQPNALYAGMGAVWASHQANLVGDSSLTVGSYLYDSCNDLELGQRQAVRIVANLNAFQQTTCEAPRGSPISLTIAHGDNQLRAIQLLSSFRVPVISTQEHFALEDYSLLTKEQRRFLFSTAPSSRHLASGALRFAKRVVSRSVASPKLANQFHRMSAKNGLIVISRQLPARFIAYLSETIPNHVNYEMLQSSSPIDQVRSVDQLESILGPKNSGSSSGSSSASTTSGGASSGNELAAAASSSWRALPDEEAPAAEVGVAEPQPAASELRAAESGESAGEGAGGEEAGSAGTTRMLSPTILMFITTDEAIDLVTRLRNDLAEVSRYYSLVVATREDISPALRTIFHRGGSRLCSGKAFYTVSPKPDSISEFSRYFRDTVQLEGETSDHPLVCEYAKYQAQNRHSSNFDSDLDDIATEAVIKAVWAAAAALKLVHKRECGALAEAAAEARQQARRQSSGSGSGGGGNGASSAGAPQQHRLAHQECVARMNRNMSNLVQRSLRRLDVSINSTGLQALDGFRLRFDELNELLTNRFSIKYINKECEITEIGHFSGLKDSALHLEEELLTKSLESTLPDPWPASSSHAPHSAQSTSGGVAAEASSSTAPLGPPGAPDETSSSAQAPEVASGAQESAGGGDEQPQASGDQLEPDAPKRRRSRPGPPPTESPGPQHARRAVAPRTRRPDPPRHAHPRVETRGGPQEAERAGGEQRETRSTNGPTLPQAAAAAGPSTGAPSSSGQEGRTATPMRELRPFPGGAPGSSLGDWLPREPLEPASTTQAPLFVTAPKQTPASATSLPESGGNTDLDEPPLLGARELAGRSASSTESAQLRANLSSGGDFVTLPSIVREQSTAPAPTQQSVGRRRVGLPQDSGPSADWTAQQFSTMSSLGPHQLGLLRDALSSSPVPLKSQRLSLEPAGQIHQAAGGRPPMLNNFTAGHHNLSAESTAGSARHSARWRLR